MKFKSTTHTFYDVQGNRAQAPREFAPMGELQRRTLERAYSTSSAVSDYVQKVSLESFQECRLVSRGDEYSASVWEVR